MVKLSLGQWFHICKWPLSTSIATTSINQVLLDCAKSEKSNQVQQQTPKRR